MSKKHKRQRGRGAERGLGDAGSRMFVDVVHSRSIGDIRIERREPPPEKMSEVILRFAAPLLDSASDDSSYKFAIEFSILVWNLSLLPEEEIAEQKKQLVEKLSGGDSDETQAIVDMLLDRKLAFFSDYKRLVVNYKFLNKGGKPELNMASTEVKG